MDEQQKPVVLQPWQIEIIAKLKAGTFKITRKNGKSKSSADVIDQLIRQGREA